MEDDVVEVEVNDTAGRSSVTAVVTSCAQKALAAAHSAGAVNCAVNESTNGRSGQAGTELRSGGFRPETARLGAIREALIGPWSV